MNGVYSIIQLHNTNYILHIDYNDYFILILRSMITF